MRILHDMLKPVVPSMFVIKKNQVCTDVWEKILVSWSKIQDQGDVGEVKIMILGKVCVKRLRLGLITERNEVQMR